MSNGAGAGVAAGGAADTDMTTGTPEKELPINLFFAAKEVLGTADAKDKARLSVLYGKEYLKRNIPLLNEGQEAPLVGPAARPADVEEDEPEIADKPPNGRVTCRMRLHKYVGVLPGFALVAPSTCSVRRSSSSLRSACSPCTAVPQFRSLRKCQHRRCLGGNRSLWSPGWCLRP